MFVATWVLFYFVTGGGINNIQGFEDEAACHRTEKDIVAILKPVRHGCIDLRLTGERKP